MLRHYALDLETMGRAAGCAVATIGAVRFDPDTGEIFKDEGYYAVVNLENCQRFGLTLEAATVTWWLEQCEEARAEIIKCGLDDESVTLQTALIGLTEFMAPDEDYGNVAVYGYGSIFDVGVLNEAYNRAGLVKPWEYRGELCGRTLRALRKIVPSLGHLIEARAVPDAPEVDLGVARIEHHAYHDAIWLAEELCSVFKALRGE